LLKLNNFSIHKIYPYWQNGTIGGDRDQLIQAYYQTAGIVITIVVAIIGGLITGTGTDQRQATVN
jgi:hypothetical protein